MVGAVYFPGHASSKPPRMLILWGELTPRYNYFLKLLYCDILLPHGKYIIAYCRTKHLKKI